MFRMIYVIKLSNVGALYGELVRMNEVLISGQRKFNFTCLIVVHVDELIVFNVDELGCITKLENVIVIFVQSCRLYKTL